MIEALANPLYYLENFELVLSWVKERYSDLLTLEEKTFIDHFSLLPPASRALFVRMVMRRGTLFRASKLKYEEIGPIPAAAAPLLARGWIENDPLLSLDQLFSLLKKTEISAIFHLSPHQQSARKADQLAALRTHYSATYRFSAWYVHSGEQVYHIRNKLLCERLRLIFFGNLRQDWSEFVLSDLGVYRYEKVEFCAAARGFRRRQDIDDYLQLQRCRERFLNQEAPRAILLDLANCALENEWLASQREKLRFQIGQRFETAQDWSAALALYAACTYPGARLRAIRVLEKSGQFDMAYEWLIKARDAPESEAEKQQLARITPRLEYKLGYPKSIPPTAVIPRLNLSLPQPSLPLAVETAVRDHLSQAEAPVYYVENTLINSLFGLLCWPAIFMPLPGAFFHPFQRGPADLHSAHFQHRRALAFAHCLAELDTEQYQTTIRHYFALKAGIESPFVVWPMLDQELIELALTCIPAAHLKQWFERILLDIHANRSGFPDLIQFWPAERRYHMIEVKGPGDRLQDNQKRWIAYCAERAMPITVCYLQWSSAR